MLDTDLVETLGDAENDFKHGIEQLIYTIKSIHGDVESLKVKTSKPDKLVAQALLEYLRMEKSKTKKNIEILCGKEIERYFKWIDNYSKENACSQEQALNTIMKGD